MTRNRSTARRAGALRRTGLLLIAFVTVIAFASATLTSTSAEHEGTNQLNFAPVADSSSSRASGQGTIEYHGGREPVSRWTATFQFSGLAPETSYVVTVMGRSGEDGSAAATAFSPICTVQSDVAGDGACWDYGLGLQRLGVVQLRHGAGDGPVLLQATREPGGPGEIRSLPNDFSPSPTAPVGSPPALGTPVRG